MEKVIALLTDISEWNETYSSTNHKLRAKQLLASIKLRKIYNPIMESNQLVCSMERIFERLKTEKR